MSSQIRLFRNCTCWFTISIVFFSHANVAHAKKIDGDRLLDPDRLIKIRIELPKDDWTQLCRQARNFATAFSGLPIESPYTYFKADLWIDGVKIESVGIRKKGFLGSADFQRPSLKVKFDKYEDQAPVKGLSRLTLNNNKQDRSQVSQFLTYRLFRKAGNPAPRSNWAHVTVNGESLGIYSNVESIKKPFLSRSFGDKSGNLYEGALADFHPQTLGNIEVKTNEDENDLTDIKRFAKLLGEDGDVDLNELGQMIDLDAFFRHWAIEGLTGFWDGYSANQNNYYLYFNPKDEGRGHFIPWGADWVFSNRGPMAGGPFGSRNRSTTVIYAQGMLANRLYHTSGVPERYRATMRRLLEENWDNEGMLAEIDRVAKLVSPHLHETQAGTPQAMDELRTFIRGRREAVETALEDWRPSVPPEPRMPAHVVDVGTAKGAFSTNFSAEGPVQPAESTSEVAIALDGKPIEFDKVSVGAQAFQMPTFGGFGGPRGGGGSAPPPSVSLVFSGQRSGKQPITVSLIIDRAQFRTASDDVIRVTGSFQEGRGGGRGFGGGPRRSVVGELRLTTSGTEPGNEVSGSIDLRIVETHGGMFQQRQGGGRSFGRPGSENSPRTSGQPQPLTIQSALDTNRDGTISAKEIEESATALKRFDRNRDGKLSGEELQSQTRGRGTRSGTARRPRPE